MNNSADISHIFNSLHEALSYSKRYFNSKNVIKDLDTNKIIAGSCSRSSLLNPVLYVIPNKDMKLDKSINSVPVKLKSNKKVLTGFDQLKLED